MLRNVVVQAPQEGGVADAIEYIYSAIELQCSEGARDRLSGCSVA